MRLWLGIGMFGLLTVTGLVPASVSRQAGTDHQQTVQWILQLQVEQGGFLPFPPPAGQKEPLRPSLRATSGAVRALQYLKTPVPQVERHRRFVMSCYDASSGAFAEPGGQPDVIITSIGVLAAVALQIPPKEYASVWNYLQRQAKTFEEIRLAAAAVEALGVKNCPFDLKPWIDQANQVAAEASRSDPVDGARDLGSAAALILRLNHPVPESLRLEWSQYLRQGQRADGGWGKKAAKEADLETTYRVLRALVHLESQPRDLAALERFVAAHRTKQGAYAVSRGEPPSLSGTYYAAAILHWLSRWK
ncbi:MAG: hypothetical protein NZU63_04830 [Gemmataceae bacterium]|nr:hypothetical protein [Gemmataceae bacterium]MDW8241890.1 prenyltransferase/squalene oxidase repeat-containing protein [Thermogemmata sp.]